MSELNPGQKAAVELCECGCGKPAPITKRNNRKLGHIKGKPVNFIVGHNLKDFKREKSYRWNGGRFRIANGYIRVSIGNGKTRFEHHIVAEQILGRSLLPSEIVHHINGDKADNSPENLTIINQNEHAKLHFTKIRRNPIQKYCPKCGLTKNSSEFAKSKNRVDGLNGWCKACQSKAKKRWKNAKRNEFQQTAMGSR